MNTTSREPSPRWYMPAEWEPHDATWIAWPHESNDWPSKFSAIPWVYAEIVRYLHHSERVCIAVNDLAAEKRVRRLLSRCSADVASLLFYAIPTDRVWTRDHGPLFVREEAGRLAVVDFRFNGWAKYDNWQHDDAVPAQIARALALPRIQPRSHGQRVVLEGGSIDVNGTGLLLTTEECLLSPIQARNPQLNREDLEKVFGQYLGIDKVFWLDRGIAGDDTHGHIDDLARFVGPRTVVAAVEDNPADENYAPLQENLERLHSFTDQGGRSLEVVPIPMPSPVVFDGRRLPASYANFYIANKCVLVPTFNDPRDRKALGILADLFPGRQVVGIHAVDLVWGLGTLHCLTQQQPVRGPVNRRLAGH